MKPAFNLKKALLVIAISAAYPLYGHAAAGIAQFTSGEVNVRRGTALIPLSKGRDIESGDSIVTGAGGRAQLRFSDGGIVSLQPDTQFVINKYVDANDPKQDSYLVDFLRGSMRTITGLIGKRNRENYKVQTTTATVGIRGSGFSASYNQDGTMSISTELDEIEVCTNGGCVRLTAGESALVVNNDAPPSRTQVRATQPTPANSQEVNIEGNKVTAKGLTAIVTAPETKESAVPTPTPAPAPTPVIQVVTGMQAAFAGTTVSGSPNLTDTVGANGNALDQFTLETLSGKTQLNKLVTTYTSPGVTNQGLTLASFGSEGAVSDAGFIGWGHWATANQVSAGVYGGTSTINDLHYVVGKPTPVNDINALSGMVGTYSLIGGTASFKPYSGASQVGIVTAGSLSVNFNNPGNINFITGSVDTKFGSTTVNVNLGTSTGCGARFGGGTANVVGFFAGAAAAKAGLTFNAPTGALGGGNVSGSAAFRKTGVSSPPS
jgi:hypothetical protein